MSGDEGYHRASSGGSRRERGDVGGWRRGSGCACRSSPARRRRPLESLVAVADSASGVAVAVDPAHATFVNGDLTIALHRAPAGEWVCLDAATTGEPHGIGLARARLWDTTGLVGRSLLAAARAPPAARALPSATGPPANCVSGRRKCAPLRMVGYGAPGRAKPWKIAILDDYQDTIRTLDAFKKVAGQDVTIWKDHTKDVDTLTARA